MRCGAVAVSLLGAVLEMPTLSLFHQQPESNVAALNRREAKRSRKKCNILTLHSYVCLFLSCVFPRFVAKGVTSFPVSEETLSVHGAGFGGPVPSDEKNGHVVFPQSCSCLYFTALDVS